MYRVAVCDDEEFSLLEAKNMAAQILRELEADYIIDCYPDTATLYRAVQQGAIYHLLLLDILFHGPEGLGLARELRKQGEECSIIVISKCADYVFDGYDIRAIKYLLKPLEPGPLKKAIAYAYRHEYRGEEKLTLACGSERLIMQQKEILYIESMRHTLFFHLDAGRTIEWGGSLSELEERLPGDRFFRCHKSYIVNLEQVQSICRYAAGFINTKRVPIGRKYFWETQRKFINLYM